MKEYLKIVYPLVLITGLSGLLLGITYQFINPILILRATQKEEASLNEVKPTNTVNIVKKSYNNKTYYACYDKNENITGYIFIEITTGYGGDVITMVSIVNGLTYKVKVISAEKETPGLGTKAKDENWISQFTNKTEKEIPANKNDFINLKLDAITGATITSLAVTRGIRNAFNTYNSIITK